MISMREIYYQHAPRAFLAENETKGTFPNFRGRTPWEETRRESSYDETGRTISEQTERTPRGLVTFDTKQVS